MLSTKRILRDTQQINNLAGPLNNYVFSSGGGSVVGDYIDYDGTNSSESISGWLNDDLENEASYLVTGEVLRHVLGTLYFRLNSGFTINSLITGIGPFSTTIIAGTGSSTQIRLLPSTNLSFRITSVVKIT